MNRQESMENREGLVKAYITSFRLRTLPLSVAGVLLGSLLAASDGYFKGSVFVWAIFTTLSLQILSNLANEVGDLDKGTDNEYRLGPIRSAQSGALSRKAMIRAIYVCVCVAVLFGTLLVYEAFKDLLDWKSVLLLFFGGLSIVSAVKYTFGKHAYGYRGFGDLFVFVFFGLVSVLGSYFAMRGSLTALCWWPAIAVGLLSTGVLNMNNIRDMDNDAVCGKRTIPVILGVRMAKIYHFILIISALVSLFIYVLFHANGWSGYLFVLTFPLFFIHLKAVYRGHGRMLDGQLKILSLTTLLLTLLVAVGQLV